MTSNRLKGSIPYLVLLLLGFAVYGDCLGHDFLRNWDDPTYVTQNPAIRAVTPGNLLTLSTSVYAGNIAPLQMLSYLLDHALWGLDPAGFKGTNILLQALCGCVLYRILVTVARIPAAPSFFASALFLVHPLQVESVAWISQRKTLLATLLILLSYLLYARFTETGRRRAGILSFCAFAASLLAKSSGIGLPLVLLAHDRCAGIGVRTSLQRIAPFMAAAAVAAAITIHVQGSPGSAGGVVDWHGGSVLSNARLALSLPASYLRLLVWPSGLSAHYPERIPGLVSPSVASGILIICAMTAAIVILLRRRNRLSLPLILIVVGFLPVMQLIPILPTMNDRYWHLPLAGIAVICASLARNRLASLPATLVAAAIVLLLAGLSFRRTTAWADSVTLWQSAVAVYPEDPRILLIMGDSWRAYGEHSLAGEFFERSIRMGQSCEALHKAAAIRIAEGSFERARSHLHRLIDSCGTDSRRDGLLLMAESYHAEGKPEEAATAYETYLKEAPNSFRGHHALGSIYLSLGRHDKAQEHLLQAVRIDPGQAARTATFTLSRLEEARRRSGRTADADLLAEALRSLAGQ